MNYIKVKDLEHLNKLLEEGNTEFCIRSGILRSSKNIVKGDNFYEVFHYIDDTQEDLSEEELMASNIGSALRHGNFYCETL